MRTKIVSWLPESCSVSSPREGEFTQLGALFLKFGTCTESSFSKCASTGNHLTVRNRNQMLPCNLYYATERLLPLRLHESGRRGASSATRVAVFLPALPLSPELLMRFLPELPLRCARRARCSGKFLVSLRMSNMSKTWFVVHLASAMRLNLPRS